MPSGTRYDFRKSATGYLARLRFSSGTTTGTRCYFFQTLTKVTPGTLCGSHQVPRLEPGATFSRPRQKSPRVPYADFERIRSPVLLFPGHCRSNTGCQVRDMFAPGTRCDFINRRPQQYQTVSQHYQPAGASAAATLPNRLAESATRYLEMGNIHLR